MAQDQIQTLKLDISKHTKLLPYERIAFHKILGILKSENGMKILLRELNKDPIVRESAISTLSDFDYDEVKEIFVTLLNEKLRDKEKINILEYLEKYGTPENISNITEFIEDNWENPEAYPVLSKAFDVLKNISSDSDETKEYLKSIALNPERAEELRSFAIVTLSSFKDIVTPSGSDNKSVLEQILKEESEEIIYAVYKAICILSDTLVAKSEDSEDNDDHLFTYSPEQEDRATLDLRVLIGKMTTQYDAYSNRIKIAFINAMISCNHREFLMYIMKALTADDPELIDMALDLLLSEANKLRDPDKLFRNLIALSVDCPRGSDSIVAIFENYFTNLKEIRRNMILKDKLYNYIVVTLESYFETYRKDFMITEVIEKDYPENFQIIRQFVLERFNPIYKKKVLNFLRLPDTSALKKVLADISVKIPFLTDKEKEDFTYLLEILYDNDEKSREISATRIDDINFEKRYLKDRIIRLCRIIGLLNIESAASQLVIIYNYLKKYTDIDMLNAVTSTLSMLNYSYMLGELEVLLATGDKDDQQKAIQYLSLFSDQRSLNILLDFLKQVSEENTELIIKLLGTLIKQDISGNVSANQILKKLIESNGNSEIKKYAILCLGRCGEEGDIDYLNEQFFILRDTPSKEAVVQAIGHIINMNTNLKKVNLLKYLKEYLKDSGIRVRIYSCFLLIQLGDKNALKAITDMMTIKNKNIQREILSILGNLRSVEFAYFLISLLKDEYAISSDIIPVIELLPNEEQVEIDHFITNIFKKHEFVDLEEENITQIVEESKPIKGLSENDSTILNIRILNYVQAIENLSIIELTMMFNDINNIVISDIAKNQGVITRIANGRILSFFHDVQNASIAAMMIYKNIELFNETRLPKDRMIVSLQLISDKVRIINDEIISSPENKIALLETLPIMNRILMDHETKSLLQENYSSEPLPEVNLRQSGTSIKFHELISPVNFLAISEAMLEKLEKEEQERIQRELELEADLKRKKDEKKSPAAITYAQALDDIARTLKNDLNSVNKYVQMRTTDRELISNVQKMLNNVYKRFFVEKSKIFIEMD